MKKCINNWKTKCESLQAKINALRVKVCGKSLANSALQGLLTDIKHKELLSEEDALALEENFESKHFDSHKKVTYQKQFKKVILA